MGDGQVTLEWADPSDSTITGYSYSYATSLSAFTSASPPAWHVIPVTREPGPRDVTIDTTGSLDTSGALEDSEGGVVASDDDGGSGNNFRIQRSLSEGTYYVRVGSSGSATGAYTLGLTAEGDGVGDDHGDAAGAYAERTSSTTSYTSRLTAEDDDHGDARSSATEVALPSETAGRIDPGSDVDYFRFEVVSETMVVTTTSHTVTGLANGTRHYFRLRATNADGDGPAAQTTIQLAASPSTAVTISDAALREAVEDALGKSAGDAITQLDMASVRELAWSQVAALSGLEHAVNLRSLTLSSGTISDVTVLGALTSLTDLDLALNSISDITALGSLTSLTGLSLTGNSISDVTALGSLMSLSSLRLGNNSISDVTALGALTSLMVLSLNTNLISDVTALGALTSLTELNLPYNSISDITALGSLTSLTYLSLGGNSISDVTALGSLASLSSLGLFNNLISDVTVLGGLASLTVLYLSGNSISDVAALGALASLTYLDLSRNSISDVTALGGLASLTVLYLSSNSISDVTALGSLTSLSYRLDLSGNLISDVTALGSLASLWYHLDLSGNLISDVTALGSLASLSSLDLSGNLISDVTALGSAPLWHHLDLSRNSISDVTALGSLTSLEYRLDLSDNLISDVTALGSLASLSSLDLSGNSISDVTALGGLASLDSLDLSGNSISDVTALGSLASLDSLDLSGNLISDVTALGSLTSLWSHLDLSNNTISDVTALGSLTSLWSLDLGNNSIENVEGIRDFALALGHGAREPALGLRGNPLSAAAIETDVPALRERGVAVLAGRPVPVFPSAGDASGRVGFVRVLNRSDDAGELLISAVDDAGVRLGPVRLAIAAGAAAHFNSVDLEAGNAAKGLPEGVGAPTVAGDWRLELSSTLDIEALGYVRTPDGFLTAMHHTLPRVNEGLLASFFNPGRNRSQRSMLRLLNPGGVTEWLTGWFREGGGWIFVNRPSEKPRVRVYGQDDRGAWGGINTLMHAGGGPALTVPRGGALTVDAAELEVTGVGLGRGVGKWRLVVDAPWPWEAVSLLETLPDTLRTFPRHRTRTLMALGACCCSRRPTARLGGRASCASPTAADQPRCVSGRRTMAATVSARWRWR